MAYQEHCILYLHPKGLISMLLHIYVAHFFLGNGPTGIAWPNVMFLFLWLQHSLPSGLSSWLWSVSFSCSKEITMLMDMLQSGENIVTLYEWTDYWSIYTSPMDLDMPSFSFIPMTALSIWHDSCWLNEIKWKMIDPVLVGAFNKILIVIFLVLASLSLDILSKTIKWKGLWVSTCFFSQSWSKNKIDDILSVKALCGMIGKGEGSFNSPFPHGRVAGMGSFYFPLGDLSRSQRGIALSSHDLGEEYRWPFLSLVYKPGKNHKNLDETRLGL